MSRRILIPLLVLLSSLPLRAAPRGEHAAQATDHAAQATASTEKDPASPDEVFAQMRHSFRADRARAQHLRFQFNFGDPQGGKWWIEIKNGGFTMGKGAIPRPDVTFGCTGADWVRLSNGTLSGFQAFITGRLHVSGNQFTARKLDEIFP